MIIGFDYFNSYELPILTLCNPNRKELGQIGTYYNASSSFRFNALSDLSFSCPYTIDNINKTPLYDEIINGRVIKTDSIGVYLITSVNEKGDGINKYKDVVCETIEYELINRKLNLFGDGETFKFWDTVDPDGTILGEVFKTIPNWSIGYVSSDLFNKYRTFDVSDNTVYNFLMTDIEQSYECIFLFDTYNQTVNAYSPTDIVKKSDIFISYENAVKECEIEEVSEDLVTALACYGSGNLDIATVNPIGSNIIYNFDYFKPMMSDNLKNAVDNWEKNIDDNKTQYTTLLTNFRTKNSTLTLENSNLVDLQSDLKAKQGVQSAQIEGGINNSDPTTYAKTVAEIDEIEKKIKEKEIVISTLSIEIENIRTSLEEINKILAINNAFTEEQYKELDYFIRENTYQDDSFLSTSEMTPEEIQDMSQALYDQSITLLDKLSSPRYNIDISSTNLLFQHKYKEHFKYLDIGTSIYLLLDDNSIEMVLLEINLQWDNPESFSMNFANRYRLNDAEWQFSDLYQDNGKATSSIDFKLPGLNDWKGHQGEVINFINSSLDTSFNEVINSSGQEMVFNQNGLRLRKINPDGSDGAYDDNQIWMINNQIVFSNSGFRDGINTAIGNITLPSGDKAYGIVGEALVGKVIIGSQLTISNTNNSFVVDENGATLTNADLTIKSSKGEIVLNPDDGILIKNSYGDSVFNTDQAGNIYMTGSITANSGSIGGWIITESGIRNTTNTNYINNDGSVKLGVLTITPGGNSYFNGNIYANNLLGQINGGSQIMSSSIPGSNIGQGTITGGTYGNIAGGTITARELQVGILEAWLADINIARVNILGTNQIQINNNENQAIIFYGTARIYENGNNFPVTGLSSPTGHVHTVVVDGRTYYTSTSGQHTHRYGGATY